MYIIAKIGLLRFPGEALGFKRKCGLRLRGYSGIWVFLISAVLDKKVRACGYCVPYKKHPTIRKNSLRSFLLMRACGNCVTTAHLPQPRHSQKLSLRSRFCSCGRAVTPFPHTRTQTKNRLPSSKASFRAGGRFCLCVVGKVLLFLYQVLHPDALLHQYEADGAFDDVGALHGEVEGEHRKGGAGCKKVS